MGIERDDEYYIDLSDPEGPSLDGQRIVFDIDWLAARLGSAPRYVPLDERQQGYFGADQFALWDDAGIAAYLKNGRVLPQLDVYFFPAGEADDEVQPRPRGVFRGYPTIDQRHPVDAAGDEEMLVISTFLDLMRGDWEASFRVLESDDEDDEDGMGRFASASAKLDEMAEQEMPYSSLSLTTSAAATRQLLAEIAAISLDDEQKQPGQDWTLPHVAGAVLAFDSFELKLAVLQELMFEQQLLAPAFDLEDFAVSLGEEFDLDDHYFTVPPEVRQWLMAYPIPAELAGRVTGLSLDAGNDIYAQAAWQWDGEDELFLIQDASGRELDQLPALRAVEDLHGLAGEAFRQKLAARGIAVDNDD